MPDEEARTTIFKNLAAKSKYDMTEEDWVTLGKESVSFTAQDCTEAVKKTMLTPAQKCQSGTRFKKTKDGGWVPTISSDLEGIDMTVMDINPKLLRLPAVDVEDFR